MDVLALWNRQKRLFSGQKSPIYRDLSIQGSTPKRKAVGSNPARDAKKRRETLDFSKCLGVIFLHIGLKSISKRLAKGYEN